MLGKRRASVLLVVLIAAAVAAGAVAYFRPQSAPSGVALINGDTGPTGAKIARALQDSGTREWDVVDSASTDDYAVIITLPTDLSADIASLGTDKPKKAQVTVTTNDRADAETVNDAVNDVTKRISASGMDTLFASMNNARGQMQQVAFTSTLLNAGVQAAADASQQFGSGADEMLAFLDQAKVGAGQITSAITELNSTVSAATTQANDLATALDSTGVTVGQVSQAADQLSTGINAIVPLLQGLPFANDPQLASIIGQLQGLQTVANQAGTQLNGVGELVGTTVTPETQLGQLLRSGATRLGDASAQLNQGGQLAASIPALADQGKTQLLGALNALSSGVTQLQSVTTTLGNQATAALNALPQRGVPQQSAIASALSDPVDIVRK
ncbi:hypothetical protein OHB26_07835 [Nocardia sp. NBC_01503]|uniref:YhgE/Pip domain-containing protein n=1 Tax=Nocardia sp. NBC_01503 TaxID=2975997 RepID=UPI002E7B17D2|nr:hypothetical protein [Nocardia sp. NBC_01503]WTL34114.1 hypothetical protein OHB26_07835 [Nocardia sp. NBC_01503]